jgi:hypothetical protein
LSFATTIVSYNNSAVADEQQGSKYNENGENNKHLVFWMFETRDGSSETLMSTSLQDDEEILFVVSTLALLSKSGPCGVNTDGKSTTVNAGQSNRRGTWQSTWGHAGRGNWRRTGGRSVTGRFFS